MVYLAVERSLAGHGTTVPPGTAALSGDQAELRAPGGGLGALAAPSLPSRWLTCFLTVSRLTTSSWAIRGLGMRAASSTRISSSRAVSCSTSPGAAMACWQESGLAGSWPKTRKSRARQGGETPRAAACTVFWAATSRPSSAPTGGPSSANTRA